MAVGIAAGTRVGGGTDYDPMRMLNEALTLRNTQAGFMARNKAGSIISQYPDDPAAAAQALQSDPMVSGFYPEAINIQRQLQLMQAETGLQQARMRGEIAGQGRDAYADVMGAGLASFNDPTQLMPSIMGTLSRYPVSLQQQLKPGIEIWYDSLMHGLDFSGGPNDAGYMRSLATFRARMAGQLIRTGHGEQLYQMMGVPAPSMQEVTLPSGRKQLVSVGGLPPEMSDPRVLAGPGATGTGAPVQAAPLQTASAQNGGDNALAIPPPPQSALGYGPPGLGYRPLGPVGPSPEEVKEQETRGTGMSQYRNDLDNRVDLGGDTMRIVYQARDLASKVRLGAGESNFVGIAQIAQAAGAPKTVVDALAGGDLGAAQDFEKFMASTAMQQLDRVLPRASRATQREWEAFVHANPHLDMDPRATAKIFDFWAGSYTKDRLEQYYLKQYLADGHDLDTWRTEWANIQQRKGLLGTNFTGADEKTGIPAEGILRLLGKPETADDFDTRYKSKGSAKKYLEYDQ